MPKNKKYVVTFFTVQEYKRAARAAVAGGDAVVSLIHEPVWAASSPAALETFSSKYPYRRVYDARTPSEFKRAGRKNLGTLPLDEANDYVFCVDVPAFKFSPAQRKFLKKAGIPAIFSQDVLAALTDANLGVPKDVADFYDYAWTASMGGGGSQLFLLPENPMVGDQGEAATYEATVGNERITAALDDEDKSPIMGVKPAPPGNNALDEIDAAIAAAMEETSPSDPTAEPAGITFDDEVTPLAPQVPQAEEDTSEEDKQCALFLIEELILGKTHILGVYHKELADFVADDEALDEMAESLDTVGKFLDFRTEHRAEGIELLRTHLGAIPQGISEQDTEIHELTNSFVQECQAFTETVKLNDEKLQKILGNIKRVEHELECLESLHLELGGGDLSEDDENEDDGGDVAPVATAPVMPLTLGYGKQDDDWRDTARVGCIIFAVLCFAVIGGHPIQTASVQWCAAGGLALAFFASVLLRRSA